MRFAARFPLWVVMSHPGVPRLMFAYVLSRMPSSMAPLALILLVRETSGSYGTAGLVAGAFGLGQALSSPILGRVIDRYGPTSPLISGAVVFAASFIVLVVTALGDSESAALMGAATAAGFAYPPVASCMRAMWPRLVPQSEVANAYTLEATVQESVFVSGPIFVSVIVALYSPAAAVIVSAICGLVGSCVFAMTPAAREWRTGPKERHPIGPLRSVGVRTVMANMVLVAIAIGFLQVAVASLSSRQGSPSLSGWLLGVWTLGSLIGGLIYGSRQWKAPMGRRMAVLLLTMTALYAALAGVTLIPLFGLLIFCAGLPLAPWTSCSYLLIDFLAPPGTAVEAFGWMATGFLAGLSLGSAAAGIAIDSYGELMALLGASASLLAATILIVLKSRTLSSRVGSTRTNNLAV